MAAAMAGSLTVASSQSAEAAEFGEWGPVLDWGVQAKHMAVLPTGNVLVWSTGLDARVWDSSSVADFTPAPFPGGDLHCAGQATLADGRIVVIGGQDVDTHEGIQVTALFDADTGTWTAGAEMAWGRWYATATTLPDGRLLATSGDDINTDRVTIPEIYDPVTDTWTPLPGADRRQTLYPYMFVAPGGKIFEAGPRDRTYFLDIEGDGSWTEGPRNSFGSSGYAESAVQYLPGKILRAGGGDPAFANAAVIDLNVPDPQWRDVAPMHHARRRHDLTLLADGRVLAVGGTGRADSEDDAVLIPEIWDPATETWTEMPAMAEARMYHSSTVLLPDGRIVVAGGETAGRKRAQVYEPSYMSSGPRPTITALPDAVAWGSTFALATPDASAITKVAMLRPSGGTHTFDHNQRYVPLTFTAGPGGLAVDAPIDGWTAPPGDYMLVIEDATGVPSVAEWVRVGDAGDLLPGEVRGTVTDAASGSPISGATITSAGLSTESGPDGRYAIPDLPAGERTLTATASGFASQTNTATVTAAGVTQLDFALVEPSTVRGRVTSTAGSPIAGALVELAGRSATTDANGDYSVEIESGTYTARVSAITFLQASTQVIADPNATQTLDVVLESAPTILEGEVLDVSTNQPIVGATVSFSGGSATTDDNGFYKFVDVTAGSYDVMASAAGYVPLTDPVLVDQGFTATLDFGLSVVPPPTTTHVAIADSRVKSTSASKNYGTDTYLRTRDDVPASTSYRSFLRFDVGDLVAPVSSARLRLYVVDGSNDGGAVHQVTWSGAETQITWNNAPPLDAPPIAQLGAVDTGTWVEVDVTSAVTGPGLVSFGLENTSTNSAFFSSREGANPPELIVETSANTSPVISSLAPLAGAVGDSVSLFGQRLDTVTGVSFGGVEASIVSQAEGEIVTMVPAGAVSGPVSVDGPDGGASSPTFTVLADPSIAGFDPTEGPSGTLVTITGTGFATTRSVAFGSSAAPFTIVSDSVITATVPAAASGGVITVTNQVGNVTSTGSFAVTDPPPVDSFQPSSGVAGTTVTFNGADFTTVTEVSFGGVPALYSVVSDTVVTASVPTGAVSGPIAITNATGTTYTSSFDVIAPPTISSFDPATGIAGATQVDVTITGTGLSTVTEVTFNGTPGIGLSIDSDTQIRVELPVGASTGPIGVTNPAGSTDTGSEHFVVLTPPPTLTFTPTDDARVRPDSTKNYGGDTYLRTRAGTWESFVRFDVAGLPNPPSAATLRLWVTDGSSGGIDVFVVDPSWAESTINGQTAPSPSGAPIASTGPVPAGEWLEIDVTAAMSGEGPLALMLSGQNTNSIYMDSKEQASAPQLVVETTPVVGPFISSFSPGSGPVGTPVDIFGSNLTTVTQLRFGDGVIHGHQLTGGAIINGSHIRVPLPAGATTGPIVAVGQDGTFTTATPFTVVAPPTPDTTPPTVVATSPIADAVDVSVSADVTATFDEAVVGVGGGTFTVSTGGVPVSGSVSYDTPTRTARFDPEGELAPDTTYTVTLSEGITDVAGTPNALPVTVWSFTTGATPTIRVVPFEAVADAKIKSSSPDSNYGSDVTLRNRAGAPEWRTLVGFDVSGLTGTVVNATVRLHVTDGSKSAGAIRAINGSWDEQTVSWSNAPTFASTVLDVVGDVTDGEWAEWDVTAAITGNGVAQFGLISDSTNSVFFDSREGATGFAPQLVITTDG